MSDCVSFTISCSMSVMPAAGGGPRGVGLGWVDGEEWGGVCVRVCGAGGGEGIDKWKAGQTRREQGLLEQTTPAHPPGWWSRWGRWSG